MSSNKNVAELPEVADEDPRQRGYSVTIEPPLDEVPTFIVPYRPDLIARGPTETVVFYRRSRRARERRQSWSVSRRPSTVDRVGGSRSRAFRCRRKSSK